MAKLLEKINRKIRKEGLGKAALHACTVASYQPLALPLRLKQRYELLTKLPQRISSVRVELALSPERYFRNMKKRTLAYLEQNHHLTVNAGAYSYKPSGPPLLYASAYAALTLHLYGEIEHITDADRQKWIQYILGFQGEDGLFRDPLIACPLADSEDWWGWRHMTLHALMALTALGGKAQKPLTILAPFEKKGFMTDWLEYRNWRLDPAGVSNEIQNYATFLQYARDFQGQAWCHDALLEIYDWLDRAQDPETGLWGNRFDDPVSLSSGVQTGYHLWLLYFYDSRPIQYIERIIDSCLKTQNRYGGYGVRLNSSACEDIDSIDPIVRFSRLTDYRRRDIKASLRKALPWLLANMNPDGGWVFRRYEAFQYGHSVMLAKREESSMFPTWFRNLALGYLAQADIAPPLSPVEWHFLRGPGLQFWETK